MSCGVGCRRGWDPELLRLWHRPLATAPTGPLAWELPYTVGVAQEMAKRRKKKKKRYRIENHLYKDDRMMEENKVFLEESEMRREQNKEQIWGDGYT